MNNQAPNLKHTLRAIWNLVPGASAMVRLKTRIPIHFHPQRTPENIPVHHILPPRAEPATYAAFLLPCARAALPTVLKAEVRMQNAEGSDDACKPDLVGRVSPLRAVVETSKRREISLRRDSALGSELPFPINHALRGAQRTDAPYHSRLATLLDLFHTACTANIAAPEDGRCPINPELPVSAFIHVHLRLKNGPDL